MAVQKAQFENLITYSYVSKGGAKAVKDAKLVTAATQELQTALNRIYGKGKAPNVADILGVQVQKGKLAGKELTKLRAKYIDTAQGANTFSGSLYKGKAALTNQYEGLTKHNEAMGHTISGYANLAKRAIAVIPIWMALRAAYSAVIGVFTEGLSVWREMNKAMLKSEAVIHNSGMSMTDSVKELREEINKIAADTGTEMKDLASTFYRFGTVGLDYKTSVEGMRSANKAAIAMMGDSDQIAQVLARTYNLLGDTMDQTLPVQEQMELMSAKLYTLWQKNAFEIDGFNQSLMQFLPTAKTLNFTFDETVSLLAALNSASLVNSRAGRLLRTALSQQVKNYEEIASTLGVKVNPNLESQFSILMKVLSAIDKLNKKGGNVTKVSNALQKIFGGVRGQEAIKSLGAVMGLLRENLEKMGLDADKVLGDFNKRVDDVTNGIDAQLNRLAQLKKQLKETFMVGLLGGDDFASAVKNFNSILERSVSLVGQLGTILRAAFNVPEGGLAQNLIDAAIGVNLMPRALAKGTGYTRPGTLRKAMGGASKYEQFLVNQIDS